MANPKFLLPSELNAVSNVTLEITAGAVVTTYIGYIHPQIGDTSLVAIKRVVRDGTDPNAITGTETWANGEMYCNTNWANVLTADYSYLKNINYAH